MEKYIYWHQTEIKRKDREKLKNHKGFTLWFTGISSCGKSTLAVAIEKILYERECHTYILDGDNIRHNLNKDLGFSPADKKENVRRIGEMAALLRDCGIINIVAVISPYISDRNAARALSDNDGSFIEVFLDCPVKICEERDIKGLYKKAREGVITEFSGISAPYEPPENPEIILNTGKYSIEHSVDIIMDYLIEHNLIS